MILGALGAIQALSNHKSDLHILVTGQHSPCMQAKLRAFDVNAKKRGVAMVMRTIGLGLLVLGLALPASAFNRDAEARARACGVPNWGIVRAQTIAPLLADFDTAIAAASRGDGDVQIIEFSDYSCPRCKAAHPQMKAFIAANPDVRLDVVTLPIYGRTIVSRTTRNRTLKASQIMVAAAEQNKQLAFHDALMERPGRVSNGAIKDAAETAGLDLAAAEALAETQPVIDQVDAHLALGSGLGVQGVPVFIVDGVVTAYEDVPALATCLAAERAKGMN